MPENATFLIDLHAVHLVLFSSKCCSVRSDNTDKFARFPSNNERWKQVDVLTDPLDLQTQDVSKYLL